MPGSTRTLQIAVTGDISAPELVLFASNGKLLARQPLSNVEGELVTSIRVPEVN